jgi:WD40 repeat protein
MESQDLSIFLKPTVLKPIAKQGGDITRRFAMNKVGRMFAAALQDRSVRLYAAESGEEIQNMQDEFLCTSLAFSPRGDIVAAGSVEHIINLWDIRTAESTARLKGHTYPVLCLAFSPDGGRLVSGSGDTTLSIWDVDNKSQLMQLKGHGFYVVTCDWDPKGDRIVSGSVDANIVEWDANSGEQIAKHDVHRAAVHQVRFSHDGTLLASGSSDLAITLWDATSRPMKVKTTLPGHESEVRALGFSPDGRYLASGSGDKDLFLWDLTTHQVVGHARTQGEIDGIEWLPQGSSFITADGSGMIMRWDVLDMGSMLAPFEELLADIEANLVPERTDEFIQKFEDLTSQYDDETLKSKKVFYLVWQCKRALGLLKGKVKK